MIIPASTPRIPHLEKRMRLPRVGSWALLAVCLLLVAHGAHAGRRTTAPSSLTGKPVKHVWLPGTDPAAPVCKLGEHGTPFHSENVVYYDGTDSYYTLLPVTTDSCVACTTDSKAEINTAHLALYFPFAPVTVKVLTSVVGSVPVTCRFQDPTVVMCGPFEQQLDSGPDGAVTVDFAIPFPSQCDLAIPPGEAFLAYTFTYASDTTSIHKPQVAVQALGRTCTSYNPVGDTNIDFVLSYQTGNPVMYVDVDRCVATPTLRKSWGQLKILYR
jgi:hypothetical protein